MVLQLFLLLREPQNRSVGRKLFYYTLLMFSIPIITFYGFRNYIVSPDNLSKDMWSGFAAVASVNVIIAFYIISAFREDQDEVKPKAPAVGVWANSAYKERTD